MSSAMILYWNSSKLACFVVVSFCSVICMSPSLFEALGRAKCSLFIGRRSNVWILVCSGDLHRILILDDFQISDFLSFPMGHPNYLFSIPNGICIMHHRLPQLNKAAPEAQHIKN